MGTQWCLERVQVWRSIHEPARVVEGAAGDAAAVGKELEGPRYRALVGAVLVGLELAAGDLDIFLAEVNADAEGAAGAALAELAVDPV